MRSPGRVAGLRVLASRRMPTVSSRSLFSSIESSSSTPGASTTAPAITDTRAETTPSSTMQFFKITLTRSAIGLGARKKATLTSLGIHRRMQTVYHPHSPEFAGKILAVKELVRIENVPAGEVKTKEEIRRERRPQRGFEVVGGLRDGAFEVNA